MAIQGLGHVAYRVKSFDASVAWYTQVLGFKEAFRTYRDDGTLAIIYLKINADNFIELFERPDGERVEVPALGMQHLCLHVDDLKQTLTNLAERGYPTEGEPRLGRDGALQYWIQDPDGNRLELMQLLPTSKQRQSL